MQELLIVNPSRRPSKRRKSTKAASPAQKRARAAFAAMSRARAGKKRRATKRKSPAKSTSITVMSNPKRRRRSASKRRRSNPSARSIMSKPFAMLTPALIGAVGATVVNTALAKLPVPATMNTGKMKYVTQAAAAIAMGFIASKVGVKGAMAAQMAEGALTVTLHNAITDVAGGFGMNLSGMGYYLPGYGVQAVPSASGNPGRLAGGMGQYMTGPGSAPAAMPMPVRRNTGMRGFGF